MAMKWKFKLEGIDSAQKITFQVEEIEIDRAEAAGVHIVCEAFKTKAPFFNVWLPQASLACFLEGWDTHQVGEVQGSEFALRVGKSDYSEQMAVGIRLVRDAGNPFKDFQHTFMFSFLVQESSLAQFIEEIRKLERACRLH